MTTWFTSDTHFGHANIIKYCNRPFKDVEEMNAEMIRRWNARVKSDDTVYHLGDFAFVSPVRAKSICEQLNGIKHIIKGNHDRGLKQLEGYGFATAMSGPVRISIDALGSLGIMAAHKPMSLQAVAGIYVYLCGHVHTLWLSQKGPKLDANLTINVGVDQHNFAPISLEEIFTLATQHFASRYCASIIPDKSL